METKTITMTVVQGNSRATLTETFSDEVTWMGIAYQFHKFLAAQGYILDQEAVGASVEDYCAGQTEENEEW